MKERESDNRSSFVFKQRTKTKKKKLSHLNNLCGHSSVVFKCAPECTVSVELCQTDRQTAQDIRIDMTTHDRDFLHISFSRDNLDTNILPLQDLHTKQKIYSHLKDSDIFSQYIYLVVDTFFCGEKQVTLCTCDLGTDSKFSDVLLMHDLSISNTHNSFIVSSGLRLMSTTGK